MKTLVLVGSRGRDGHTARAAGAFSEGACGKGAVVTTRYLPEMSIERCRQCRDDNWGECLDKGKCVIGDDLHALAADIRANDCIVFANPVFFGDWSESFKSFLDRLRRTTLNEEGRRGISGKSAYGVCVAGGGGGGSLECARRMEGTLRDCGFDVIDIIPVRRQNIDDKLEGIKLAGAASAGRKAAAKS